MLLHRLCAHSQRASPSHPLSLTFVSFFVLVNNDCYLCKKADQGGRTHMISLQETRMHSAARKASLCEAITETTNKKKFENTSEIQTRH